MKVLVTGTEGQLVRSMIEKRAGWPEIELLAVGRPEADLEVPGSVARAIEARRPDAVVNAAAFTAVDQAEDEPARATRINADAAGEAAAAARSIGAPIVQLSTDYVFSGDEPGALSEDSPTGPIGTYGRSKLAGEEQVRAANPDHLIVRTAWVYSPFGRNFVRSMVKAAEDRDTLSVVDDQRGSPTSALDLAGAILHVLDQWRRGGRTGLGETYHVAGSGETSWCGLAEEIMRRCRELGLPAARVVPIKTSDWPTRARRPANSVLDCAKFECDFGLRLPEWQGSVGEVVARLAEQVR
ncbi:MAG TPA: dTDP-4-dehydrorhamnose reductase [Sphingomicrobium sp.]|nr:dTDP-4-dehydrorhamnose reductase [Sphingomicrobium sp.]